MADVKPEEAMAQRFQELYGLTPPVDVLTVAKKLARVRFLDFPAWINADGITQNLKHPLKRTTILLNQSVAHHRRRFTIAHEIGHIIIPWHIGDIVDDLSAADERSNSRYRRMEAEANRFAAELLMPRNWVTNITSRVEHLRGAIITIAQVADVSLAAASLRAMQFGPPGYVIAHTRDGTISLIGQTAGTNASLPTVGDSIDKVQLSAFEPAEVYANGNAVTYIWKELSYLPSPELAHDNWRAVLAEMLEVIPLERRKSAHTQINAIVGYRLGKHSKGSDPDAVYRDLVKAFEHRTDRNEDVVALRNHSLFEQYLLGRIIERANQG